MNQVAGYQAPAQKVPSNPPSGGTSAEQPSELIAFVSMIERAARDPNVDVDKMERLLAMQERIIARNAKAAYQADFAEMKPKLPVIDRKGRIEIREKDAKGGRTGAITQSTAFARWEDIDEAITPILHAHGFSLTFRTDATAEGKIIVTAVLAHKDGHDERTSIPPLPFDTSGSKNNVQAVGSSLSYGKRYAATLLLNIRTKGEDDDGVKGGAGATLSEQQIDTINNLLTETKANVDSFLALAEAESVSDIPAAKFDVLMNFLKMKKASKRS